jgi:carboxymethylenebutenolidase
MLMLALATACQPSQAPADTPGSSAASAPEASAQSALPASASEAQQRLAASPRHAEWVTVRTGEADSVRAWLVYPERAERAPVVLVVHEIFGVSHWIRAVADQLAADGFIAVAPDLLTMRGVPAGSDGAPDPEVARAEIGTLHADDIHRQLSAVATYAMALPAALPRYGVVGFCWGGAVAFRHAAEAPALGTAVVYYGTSPDAELLARVTAPVLGLYGENDARVNVTIEPAVQALRARGATFEPHVFPGAGHGFLRAQDGQDGANRAATSAAWALTLEWLRTYLDVGGDA